MDGQIRFEYGNVWTWKLFLNLQRKICGFKNIWIRADGALFPSKTPHSYNNIDLVRAKSEAPINKFIF